ncbi:uncharacterized protein N7483_009165 [Penicillium malachiteum]|uniref:uncharacterized protein n=1 Tax=Penicillium malachiteum TaxID=1324776 RepID=UPI002547708A|nr:uncharacterized protein N7483_009165 [Penicillium malachiteum]KAJ5721231.1 hypothetical protein N7483_009165 [Penicillium malachiteum]
MRIDRFRTVWGIEPGTNLDNWAKWFPELKEIGYNGVEVNIHGLEPNNDFPRLRKICDDLNFDISILGHSSWVDYAGPRPVGLTASDHLQNYRDVLQLAEPLRPVSFNFQSGQDAWDVEESIKFYRGALEIDKGLADFSHWMVGLERIIDIGEEDRAMMEAIVPHVYHIHSRIGTTQASQCPEPMNPVFEQERLCFERLWTQVLQRRIEEDPNTRIIFVPEYGPFPYHPIGSAKTHGQVADEEGKRLDVVFTQFVASLTNI